MCVICGGAARQEAAALRLVHEVTVRRDLAATRHAGVAASVQDRASASRILLFWRKYFSLGMNYNTRDVFCTMYYHATVE